MGPGPPRDVLAALLNGSHFDYVMTGSLSNPAGVEHIILITRSDGAESTGPMGNPAIAVNLAGQQPSQPYVTGAETTSDSTGDADADDSVPPTRVVISEGVGPPQGYGEQPPAQWTAALRLADAAGVFAATRS